MNLFAKQRLTTTGSVNVPLVWTSTSVTGFASAFATASGMSTTSSAQPRQLTPTERAQAVLWRTVYHEPTPIVDADEDDDT